MLIALALTAQAADLEVGPGKTYTTLDDAVLAAINGDRILLEPGTWTMVGTLMTDLTFVGRMGPEQTVIVGGGSNVSSIQSDAAFIDVTLDGESARRVLSVGSGASVRLLRTVVRGGASTSEGGGIRASGASMLFEASEISTSTAATDGGCVYSDSGTITSRGTVFTGCTATVRGGGMRTLGTSTSTFEGSRFDGNMADIGGGLWAGGAADVTGSWFTANGSDPGDGGGIFVPASGSFTMVDSWAGANTSADRGGGLYANSGGDVVLLNTFWEANFATRWGGAVGTTGSSTLITRDSWFFDNTGESWGGGVSANNGGMAIIERSGFCQNFSFGDGGAIDTGHAEAELTNLLILDNDNGSGSIWSTGDNWSFEYSAYVGNTGTNGGAAHHFEQPGSAPADFRRNVVTTTTGNNWAVSGGSSTVATEYNWYFDNSTPMDVDNDDPTDTTGVDPLLSLNGCELTMDPQSPLIAADIGPFAGTEGAATLAGLTDADGDGFVASVDCDDADPFTNPEAPESCDGVDSDCDGLPDALDRDAFTGVWFADLDGDGAGDPGTGRMACGGEGLSAVDTDCDDRDPFVSGGSFFMDADGDGFGDPAVPLSDCVASPGVVDNSLDCDDSDAAISPNGGEVCDAVDNDCDGLVDDADPEVMGGSDFFPDGDGDGYGDGTPVQACAQPVDTAPLDGDCDDANDVVYPGAPELCDGLDNDCDPATPDGTADLPWYEDQDGDGFGAGAPVLACGRPAPEWTLTDGDCDDASASVNPDGLEVCDGLDNDCNGTVDDNPADGEVGYADLDGDGFGGPTPVVACSLGSGLVDDHQDCDDTDAAVNPAAVEVCDGDDEDCDGLVDDADADVQGQQLYAADTDGDGWGEGALLEACVAPSGYAQPGDCDDTDADVNPDAVDEPADGVDQDCDGADAELVDTDGDGIPDHVEDRVGSDAMNEDSDGDGVDDGTEFGSGVEPLDSDGDTTPDLLDTDDDDDGILTLDETDGDADGDGIPNHLDLDSDDDGVPDSEEPRVDTDGDGIPEFLDANDGPEGPDIRGQCGCSQAVAGPSGGAVLTTALAVIAVFRRRR